MKDIIRDVNVLGIIGLAKNTGKTTTLNHIINICSHEHIGLTSIGLDGEELDQVNFLPKPKILVHPGMVIATTKLCLEGTHVQYRILEETDLTTAIGNVWIIEIQSEGHLVVAGPTTNSELQLVLTRLKKYVQKILVDGAFNRMTFANIKSLEAIMLATGASYHLSMDKTIAQTRWIVESFNLPTSEVYEHTPKDQLIIETKTHIYRYADKKLELFDQRLSLNEPIQRMFIKGAITSKMIAQIITKGIGSFELICEDPTKLLITHQKYAFIQMRDIKLKIIHQANLIAVTINPFSPMGHHYDKDIFLSALKKVITVPVYNVKDME